MFAPTLPLQRVADLLAGCGAHCLGLQEVAAEQLRDLRRLLPPRFASLSEGRDGGQSGEHCPIFCDPAALHLVDGGTFWLAEDPSGPCAQASLHP